MGADSLCIKDMAALLSPFYAEQLIALFHEEEPLVLKDSVDALPRMDFRLWHYGWPTTVDDEQREIEAEHCVICGGGIETPKLLLASTSPHWPPP